MKKTILVSLVLGALMVATAGVTKVVTPTRKMADLEARFELATMVPERFGDWALDTSFTPLEVDPDTQARLDRIYNQTLSRTYVNGAGQRIMLSIAYGGDQSDNMGVHKPEVCYTAQGFAVTGSAVGRLPTPFGALPVRRLYAVSGSRNEPITYWITIGKKASEPGTSQRLELLRYGLSGMIADGMLVRVSSIDSDVAGAYALQERFVNAMLASLDERARVKLIGVFGL